MPVAPRGVVRWAASPTRNTRPACQPVETAAAKVQGNVPITSTSRPGTPAASRMAAIARSSVQSAGVVAPFGVELAVEHPAPVGPRRHEHPELLAGHDHVQRVAFAGQVPGEVRAEQGAQVRALVAEDLHVQADEAPYGALATVGTDHPPGLDGLVTPSSVTSTVTWSSCCREVEHPHPEAGLGAELEQPAPAAPAPRGPAERRRTSSGLIRARTSGAVAPSGNSCRTGPVSEAWMAPATLRSCEPARISLLQAPGAHQLHGARAEAGGLGEDGGAGVPVDEQDPGARAGGRDGGGQARRAGADDEDVVAVGGHLWFSSWVLWVTTRVRPAVGAPDP